MHELALFAGVGGGLLATTHLLGWETVCYVENAAYPVEVLKARIRDGLLDDAPIWDDARTFDGKPWAGCVDIITAGFPCQPFSGAGKQRGEHDERNLWPDTIRIIREVGPRYVLLENVSRLLSHQYFGRILGDLAESGYDCRWDCIPASAVGANHQRDRVWIVATHADSTGLRLQPRGRGRPGREEAVQPADDGQARAMAHATSERRTEAGQHRPEQSEKRAAGRGQEVAHAGGCGCTHRQAGVKPARSGQQAQRLATTRGEKVADPNSGGLQECAELNSESQDDSPDRDPQGRHAGGRSDEVADPDSTRLLQSGAIGGQQAQPGARPPSEEMADTGSSGPSQRETEDLPCHMEPTERRGWWAVEPGLGRVVDGMADRVERVKAIGNGQVPLCTAVAFLLLAGDYDGGTRT